MPVKLIPIQFSANPPSRSHVDCVRSNHRPSSGWSTEDVMLNIIATRPASKYESPKRTVKTGRRPESRFENISLTVWPTAKTNDEVRKLRPPPFASTRFDKGHWFQTPLQRKAERNRSWIRRNHSTGMPTELPRKRSREACFQL